MGGGMGGGLPPQGTRWGGAGGSLQQQGGRLGSPPPSVLEYDSNPSLTLTLTTDLNPNPNPNQPSYGAPPPTWGAAQNSGQNAALRRLAEKDPWEVHLDQTRALALALALTLSFS